jgi:probable HAF family extracellular repeat protein
MLVRNCLLALSLLSAVLPLHAAAAPRYKVTILPHRFYPVDINNAGAIAGNVSLDETRSHAAVLVRGKIVDLGTLGGNSSASAINEAGQVTGTSWTRDPDTLHAFLYSRGRMIDLDGRPGKNSYGESINAKGQVVGQFYNRNDQPVAFVYAGRGMRDIGTLGGYASLGWDINDAGVIVGESVIKDPDAAPFEPYHPFMYYRGVMRDLGVLQGGGHTASAAQKINNAGQMAGYSEVNGYYHLFFYERGMMTDLGFFGGQQLTVRDMNERGSFVGDGQSQDDDVAFVYTGGQLHNLDALIASPGWHMASASGINDQGQIVGIACRRDTTCESVRLDPVQGHHR